MLRGEELIVDGQHVDPRIDGSLTGAFLVRRLDGSMSLELTIADQDMLLLLGAKNADGTRQPAAFTRPGKPSARQQKFSQAAWDRFETARLTLDGYSFLLAGSQGNYDALPFTNTVTFADEMEGIMRRRTEPVKVSRGQDTRAEFNRTLVRRALAKAQVPFTRAIDARFYSPQAGQREPIAEPKEDGREKGFARGKNFNIKTARATAEQRENLTIALTEADRLKAGERATLALIVAGITENRWINSPDGHADSSGVLQVQQRTAVGITPRTVRDPRGLTGSPQEPRVVIPRGALDPMDIREVTRIFLLKGFAAYQGGAIKYAAENPDAEIWAIAQAMQASGEGRASNGQSNYGPWVEQAKEILAAWGGAGQTYTIRESFEFRAGGRRNGRSSNYWNDSGNSAEQVRWRRFADLNRVWFVPDDWLFQRKPVFVVDGTDGPAGFSEQGILGLSYQADIGLPVAEIQVQCLLPRWGGPPGGVFEFENTGPLTGRWLIAQNRMDLLATPETAVLTLNRPAPKRKEPAPRTTTVQRTETLPEAGSVRERIVAAAEEAHKLRANYFYLQKRPMHDSLFQNRLPDGAAGPAQPMGIDCSEFVTLVYKAADAPDPNGSGYNGQGYTGTLRANGRKTNDPQPGDLVHWGSGGAGGASHVGIYIGDGKTIHMGSHPGPLKDNVRDVRTDFAGYWTHDLS